MNKEILALQAARYAFGTFNTQEMQQLINDLIDEGIFEDVFLDVIWPEVDTRERVGVAFERVMQCLGVDIPDYEQAVWIILRYYISCIARDEVDPLKGIAMIMDEVYWNYVSQTRTNGNIVDSHDIGMFLGIYWGYDDLLAEPEIISYEAKYGNEAIEELKKLTLAEAGKWLEKYPEAGS